MLAIMETHTTFVAKKEIEKYPFVNKAIGGIEGLFLDRADLKQSLKVMMKVQSSLKEGKLNWVIYPEGTRIKDSLKLVGDFHHGTFRAPIKANVPIVPVVIYGTNRVLKLKPEFKKYIISISILPPIYPQDYEGLSTEEVATKCHSEIQKELTYSVRTRNHKLMAKYNKKNYKFEEII
jgi:1-acyl-sn-glycerol-3-phosphate acyltransferase